MVCFTLNSFVRVKGWRVVDGVHPAHSCPLFRFSLGLLNCYLRLGCHPVGRVQSRFLALSLRERGGHLHVKPGTQAPYLEGEGGEVQSGGSGWLSNH